MSFVRPPPGSLRHVGLGARDIQGEGWKWVATDLIAIINGREMIIVSLCISPIAFRLIYWLYACKHSFEHL